MQLNVSNSSFLVGLAALAVLSVSLKAAGPAEDTSRSAGRAVLEDSIAGELRNQGFKATISPQDRKTSIIFARRGSCRLSVRDAREGPAVAAYYARDAKGIGPVRYLYRGKSYDMPPGMLLWLDHFRDKLFNRLAIPRHAPVAIALATSPGCSEQDFGLSDVRILD